MMVQYNGVSIPVWVLKLEPELDEHGDLFVSGLNCTEKVHVGDWIQMDDADYSWEIIPKKEFEKTVIGRKSFIKKGEIYKTYSNDSTSKANAVLLGRFDINTDCTQCDRLFDTCEKWEVRFVGSQQNHTYARCIERKDRVTKEK